ncbi:MAG: EboA domain-containing protein [Rhodospirillales bacterium]|nr:EboA domain-containing protein [Rhodospirillales bacterium]
MAAGDLQTHGPGTAAAALLGSWLDRQLPVDSASWLREAIERIVAGGADKDLFLVVSLVPRRIGKQDLILDDADVAAASARRPGWDPRGWSVDQAARLRLLLAVGDGERLHRLLERLFVTADVGELVAFYRGLPLFPCPDLYLSRASEGARSNMKAVFEAVAHRNPYPAEQFSQATWNQLILKALFVGSALAPIQGIDSRANADLAVMLCDYAHERWAAGREVSPELWRCVGPHAEGGAIEDLQRVLKAGTAQERTAAALALAACPRPQAAAVLDNEAELAALVRAGRIGWNDVVA